MVLAVWRGSSSRRNAIPLVYCIENTIKCRSKRKLLLLFGARGASASSSPFPSSSEETTTTTTAENAKEKAEAFVAEHTIPPRGVFPWRHSPYALPRLHPKTIEHEEEGGALGPGMMPLPFSLRYLLYVYAAYQMNIPWHNILFFHSWQQQMADFMGLVAFPTALNGMLRDTYHLSPPDDQSDDDSQTTNQVNFHKTFHHNNDLQSNNNNNDDDDHHQLEDDIPDQEYMLQHSLRNLYHSAHHSHKMSNSNIQITLQTQPLSTHLESLMIIPMLTRQKIQDKPALRHAYRNIYKHLNAARVSQGRRFTIYELYTQIMDQLEQLADKTATYQHTHHDHYDQDNVWIESTIIAQVSVQCLENFQVKDVNLDQIIQGNDDSHQEEHVTHLVRFEMVVKWNVQTNESCIGTWQITDWDDLLGGNIWFK